MESGDNLILMESKSRKYGWVLQGIVRFTYIYIYIYICVCVCVCVPKHHTLLENQVPPGCNWNIYDACKNKFRFQIHLVGRYGQCVLSAAQEIHMLTLFKILLWRIHANKYSSIYISPASGSILQLQKNIYANFCI